MRLEVSFMREWPKCKAHVVEKKGGGEGRERDMQAGKQAHQDGAAATAGGSSWALEEPAQTALRP